MTKSNIAFSLPSFDDLRSEGAMAVRLRTMPYARAVLAASFASVGWLPGDSHPSGSSRRQP